MPSGPSVAVRPATPADAGAIVTLVEGAYRGEASRVGWTTEADLLEGQRTDLDAVLGILDDADSVVLLAGTADRLRGCVLVRQEAPGEAYIGMLAVRPAAQAGGLGRTLLSEAERLAVSRWHAHRARMTVIAQRPELIAWYERRGYRRTGETEPFPYGDERFGRPVRNDLYFVVLSRTL